MQLSIQLCHSNLLQLHPQLLQVHLLLLLRQCSPSLLQYLLFQLMVTHLLLLHLQLLIHLLYLPLELLFFHLHQITPSISLTSLVLFLSLHRQASFTSTTPASSSSLPPPPPRGKPLPPLQELENCFPVHPGRIDGKLASQLRTLSLATH